MAAAGTGPSAAVVGAIISVVGVLVMIAACALPLQGAYEGERAFSIFSNGPTTAWFAALPVATMVLSIIAAGIVALSKSAPRAVAAGMLMAFGLATTFNFIGYTGSVDAYPGIRPPLGFGGPLGILSGVLLFAGGLIVSVNLGGRRTGT
jgi:hypothetical protein